MSRDYDLSEARRLAREGQERARANQADLDQFSEAFIHHLLTKGPADTHTILDKLPPFPTDENGKPLTNGKALGGVIAAWRRAAGLHAVYLDSSHVASHGRPTAHWGFPLDAAALGLREARKALAAGLADARQHDPDLAVQLMAMMHHYDRVEQILAGIAEKARLSRRLR